MAMGIYFPVVPVAGGVLSAVVTGVLITGTVLVIAGAELAMTIGPMTSTFEPVAPSPPVWVDASRPEPPGSEPSSAAASSEPEITIGPITKTPDPENPPPPVPVDAFRPPPDPGSPVLPSAFAGVVSPETVAGDVVAGGVVLDPTVPLCVTLPSALLLELPPPIETVTPDDPDAIVISMIIDFSLFDLSFGK
jgi:hypothetical protein